MMEFTRIPCGMYQANAYLLCPEDSPYCMLADPGDDLPALRRAIADSGRSLKAIFLTHGHFDHTLAAQPLAEETGADVYIHIADGEILCDPDLNAWPGEGVTDLPCPRGLRTLPYPEGGLDMAGVHFDVIHTPGHTPGCVCLYDKEDNVLLSGDTLFAQGFGRYDFPGGSPMQLRDSLRTLLAMDDDIRLLSGHGEESTIARARGYFR